MIKPKCFTPEWITGFRSQRELSRIDPSLLEKMIHALYLVQNLKKAGLDFVFKGGTSLILLLEDANRFSIDVDIIVNKKYGAESTRREIDDVLAKIIESSAFTKWTLDEKRSYQEGIPKAHYKLEYQPQFDRAGHVLLDILFEKNYYPQIIETPVAAKWIESEEIISVPIPDINSITGDKLTAFAPKTTGIKYGVEKELEIIKQLFDIGELFEKVDSMETVAASFHAFAQEEIGYRNLTITSKEVLDDIIETAKLIAFRDKNNQEPDKSHFLEIKQGIRNFTPFLISGKFYLDLAITAGAKAAYLAAKILREDFSLVEKYQGQEISALNIENKEWNFFNKLKKLPDKSAFFYWYQSVGLLTRED